MRLAAAVLAPALLLSSCAYFKKQDDRARPEPVQLVVLVVNEAITETLVIRTADGRRFGTVLPGRAECIFLPNGTFSTRLVATPVGGSTYWVSPTFSAAHSERWEWDVGSSRTAAGGLNLMPADFECDRDRAYARRHPRPDTAAAPDTAPADTTRPPAR
jgi:hypothetical protein